MMGDRKVSKTVTDEGVKFEFATGEVVEVKVGDFKSDIQKQLMLHGLSQKLGDSYSGEDADKCHTIFQGVLKNLTEGSWSARAGGGAGRISQLAAALSRAAGEPVEKCVEKLSEMDDAAKKTVREHPAVQAALAEIKLEKAQEDAKKLKAELGEDVAPIKLG
jgi:hypothetical protein